MSDKRLINTQDFWLTDSVGKIIGITNVGSGVSTDLVRTDFGNQFTTRQYFAEGFSAYGVQTTGVAGTGKLVYGTAPTITDPVLGGEATLPAADATQSLGSLVKRWLKGWFSTAHIGDSTNYSEFADDGTLTMYGTATTFDDVVGPAVSLRISGPGLSANVTESTLEYLTTADLSDYIYTNVQLPHKWKVGSVIYPHIHYPQIIAAQPNFLVQYRWQKLGGIKVTAWTSLKCNTPLFTYTPSTTLNQLVTTVAGITPPTGSGISDVVQFRVLRDNANASGVFAGADPIAAVVSLDSFDIHVETDTLGSRNEFAK